MEQAQFEADLARDGFTAPVPGTWEPNRRNPPHGHPFELRGMVLEGEMTIACGDERRVCGPGDIFVMALGQEHQELVGPQGVSFIYGKRPSAAAGRPSA